MLWRYLTYTVWHFLDSLFGGFSHLGHSLAFPPNLASSFGPASSMTPCHAGQQVGCSAEKSGWLSRNMQISRVVGYCHTSVSFITVANLWQDLLVVLPPFHFWFKLCFTWFVILEWPKGASINTLVYFLKNIYQLLVRIQVALSTTNQSTPGWLQIWIVVFDLAAKISLEFNLVGAASPPMALNTTTGPWAWTQWWP